jgi:4-alpha-glucanotransferase
MGTVTLLMGIHNHQPEGNFEHVFAQGYEDCYARLLAAVEEHAGVKLSLHYSGPLVEWIEAHHPDYFDRISRLVASGRVEVMGGGFYEPMLSVLPERDARGQLRRMADFLEARVGRRPQGLWLAERVWEPDLARTIGGAGYRYTIVDEGHFLSAGMRRPLYGYYITDKAGVVLCLFPISRALRYAIPFRPAEEAIGTLLHIADAAGDGDVLVTYGDDGEKFGMWPGTKKWVWEERWLDQFLGLLEKNADRIRTATFSEALARRSPSGRVYLPTASYDEMGEWSLPAEAQGRFHALHHLVEASGRGEDLAPFVRGGIWQGFLAKYPESNFMHKRMCFVSQRVHRAGEAVVRRGGDPEEQRRLEGAVRELYKGQCNCAYWHGLFGGLYLAKLRAAVHTHLIRADVLASGLLRSEGGVVVDRVDLDGDLEEEVVISGPRMGVVVSPARGGALMAVDDRVSAFSVTDVLTRRPEAYHDKVRELAAKGAGGGGGGGDAPRSIHDITNLKEEGLHEILVYDPYQRLAFVDQFFPAEIEDAELIRCTAVDLGDFREAPFDLLKVEGGSGRVVLGRRGRVRTPSGDVVVEVEKSISLDGSTLTAAWEISPVEPLRGLVFATEVSLALPSGPSPSGRFALQTRAGVEASPVTHKGGDAAVERLELRGPTEDGAELGIVLVPAKAARVIRFPLESVSQSESGIERTYQGSTVVFLWRCEPDGAGRLRPSLKLSIESGSADRPGPQKGAGR